MARSLALALHLFLAGGGGAREPARDRPARPDGRLVWMHLSPDTDIAAAGQLARRILADLRNARLLVTISRSDSANPPDLSAFPAGTLSDRVAAQQTGAADAAVTYWQPAVLLLVGNELPPALVVAAAAKDVPLVACDVGLSQRGTVGTGIGAALVGGTRWALGRGLLSALMPRFDRVLVRDHATAERLLRLPVAGASPVVTGPLEDTAEPLLCAEAEREAMADLTATRPIWLATAVPEAEEEAVIAAHAHAMRLAHKMLLIFVPAIPSRAQAVAERMSREGWVIALRSHEQDPVPDVQVLIDDGEGEYGLWYRLAPVTYLGGSLSAGGSGRSPMEPAALGSAILAGSSAGRFGRDLARLTSANAVRSLRSPGDLADGVAEMIAADRAAQFAHNAWAASSSGIETADRIALAVVQAASRRPLPDPDLRAGTAAAPPALSTPPEPAPDAGAAPSGAG
jgi:3-deoxy-D-manno-octulosonic-acid transferase